MGLLFEKKPGVNKFSSVVNPSLNGRLASELKPVAPGTIDVINDFPWTLSPVGTKIRDNAPVIYLTEYFQLQNQLNQSLTPYGTPKDIANTLGNISTGSAANSLSRGGTSSGLTDYFINTAGLFIDAVELAAKLSIDVGKTFLNNNTNNVYEGLFDLVSPTDFKFKLPFFTDTFYSVNNTWNSTDILDSLTEFQANKISIAESLYRDVRQAGKNEAEREAIDKKRSKKSLPGASNIIQFIKDFDYYSLMLNNPAVGLMDPPNIWNSTEPREYTFSFPLFNVEQNGVTTNNNIIQQNWELCYLLTYQNLVNKNNFITGIPPVYYEVLIPGIHYCKASYISKLDITNIGNTRLMQVPVGDNNTISTIEAIIPDAYMVSITLKDLLMPSKNLLNKAIDPVVISSITK